MQDSIIPRIHPRDDMLSLDMRPATCGPTRDVSRRFMVHSTPMNGSNLAGKKIHVYVHVPFCIERCLYCDFDRTTHRAEDERRYVGALCREIPMRIHGGATIETLYFGGGTPSILSRDSWTAIFSALKSAAIFSEDAEVTMEANPATVTSESVHVWDDAGINRVSVGVQSLDDGILQFLGRIHNSTQAVRALEMIRHAPFRSVSADIIYGIPGQTVDDNIDAIRRLAPQIDHLSAYSLTLGPATILGRRGIQPLDDDDAAAHSDAIVSAAADAGLIRYEVSNFARPGFECRHNRNTWRHGAYIGLGPAAAGFDGRRRYHNHPDVSEYVGRMDAGLEPCADEEFVDPGMALGERLMLGLRTTEGAALTAPDLGTFRATCDSRELGGCFDWSDTHVRIRPEKMMMLDEILSKAMAAR